MTDGPLPVFDEDDAALNGWLIGHAEPDGSPMIVVDCDCGHMHGIRFGKGGIIQRRRKGGGLVFKNVTFVGPRHPGPPEEH